MARISIGGLALCVTLLGVLCVLAWTVPAPAESPAASGEIKVSTYAPAAEIAAQLQRYLEQMTEDLSDEAGYGDEQRARLTKDASTVAALAMTLALHDEPHALRAAAPAILVAARKLADAAPQFAAASAALAQLKQTVASPNAAPDAGKVAWGPAASLPELMKQVPIVNNSLRRNVTGKRFKQTAAASAGLSATLAAIAQVSRFDDVYCSSAEEKAKWNQVCMDMRDASAQVLTAVRQGNQASATEGLAKLAQTCDACHHDFRD